LEKKLVNSIEKLSVELDTLALPNSCGEESENCNILYTGLGGCCKTQKLVEIYKKSNKSEKILVLTPTAISRENLLNRGVDIAKDFDQVFNEDKSFRDKLSRFAGVKLVIVDEIFFTSKKWHRLLIAGKRLFNFRLICAGDDSQLLPVEKSELNPYPIDYIKHRTFLDLFDKIENLMYQQSTARYDIKLKDEIENFLLSGKLKLDYKISNIENCFNVNICKRNVTKKICGPNMYESIHIRKFLIV